MRILTAEASSKIRAIQRSFLLFFILDVSDVLVSDMVTSCYQGVILFITMNQGYFLLNLRESN